MALDLTRLKTYSVKQRKSKVALKDLATVVRRDSFSAFYKSLPHFLAANGFREVVEAVRSARKRKRPVLFFMGAHVLKCGLSPLVNQLIRSGWINHVGANGACLVHDFEIAYAGKTSEDVASSIQDGSFGMAEETATFLNHCAKEAQERKRGLGETFGRNIKESKFPHRKTSVFAECVRSGISSSIHVAIGTDIIHQHASCDGGTWGDSSYRDFKILVEQVMRLDGGGVVLNFGSNVIMPEVFLKALSVARNLTGRVRNFTTANFDMLFHYRPNVNIVERPVLGGGKGHYLIGHHEIMLPLLATALLLGRKVR